MTTISERIATMEEQITELTKKFDKHMTEQREDFNKVFDKIDALDNKYAPKIALYIASGAFLTALGIIVSLIMMGG